MFAKERQSKIFQILKRDGAVTTAALVKLFGTSAETVRRDLLEMESQGLLLRAHGGAVATGNMKPYLQLSERNREFTEEKHILSRIAAEQVKENDIIGLDTGSTAICFAEALKQRFRSLTVVTYSLDVFNILCDSLNVILCGGSYMQNERSFYGPAATDMLSRLHMQKGFIFPSALSLEFGIGDYNTDLLQMQRQLLKSADEIFVLADSSKLEKKALYKLDDMRCEYNYVTDRIPSSDLAGLYSEKGINIFTGEKKNVN